MAWNDDHDENKPRVLTVERRKYATDCAYCDMIRTTAGGHGPYHDASHRCESGKHSHCTCDSCF